MTLAYLDPATLAMVLQIIVAAVVGVGVFFRNVLLFPVTNLFHKGKAGSSELSKTNENDSP